MDYVDWCSDVLAKLISASSLDSWQRGTGVNQWLLKDIVFGNQPGETPNEEGDRALAAARAADGLAAVGVIEQSGTADNPNWKVTSDTELLAKDFTTVWQYICSIALNEPHVQLLHAVNRLSPRAIEGGYVLESLTFDVLGNAVDWDGRGQQIRTVARELDNYGLVWYRAGLYVQATYKGLVWETRCGFTEESRFIDELVAEWETTSVDFKRELHLDTKDQKAELIKDVLGLANTQASGRRWIIVGFDDKTHAYYGPPDPAITQNRIEQILQPYTAPMVNIRFQVVDYRAGPVGKLEVLRDRKVLPYQVARSIGDKKRIEAGTIFVRHGSQTEPATPAELQAIEEEGKRARSSDGLSAM